uniref:Transcription factor Pcc1 n=1 Tax=Tetraselmis chuii TaxID=63592 RepID=A0A6U1EEW5_9CHLO|mmetsp:Transcript_13077/g.23300  ORF Transcript_13077/g.23300 Transcript_13077/m.23300 type:complete len:118 (+) Transcript_13077:227-580(+)
MSALPTPAVAEQVRVPEEHTQPEEGEKTKQAKAYQFCCEVTLSSHDWATMVRDALCVDPELRPTEVTRDIIVKGNTLYLTFSASEPRLLRSAVGPFTDLLGLAVRALESFGATAEGV